MVLYRKMSEEDINELSLQLSQNGVYGPLKKLSFTKAFLRRGLRDTRLNVFLAIVHGRIVGWTIAIRCSRTFWVRFLATHPLWSIQIVTQRIRSILNQQGRVTSEFRIASEQSEGKGSDSVHAIKPDEIASHLDITVLSEYRERGVAVALQKIQLHDLRQAGVKRVCGVVAEWNLPSIRFHRKNSWQFMGNREGFHLIRKDI